MKNYFIQYLKFVSIFLLGFLFFACKNDNEMQQKIVGKWYAAQLIECDEVIPIERENVNLALSENGKYIFNSTLNIHEEGDFNVKDSLLYTKDLLKNDATIKVVKIVKLNHDTLELAMNYKGKEQILSLLREQPIANGQMKTVNQSHDTTKNNLSNDTTNNNATIAAATTAAVAATALAATATSSDTAKNAKKELEKQEVKKEEKKEPSKSSIKEPKKSKKELEREKREKEEERKDREKEKKKREKARKEREKREKEEERKDRERERKKREKAKKKKK